MAERLTDLLHHTVDGVPVPHPDAFAIAAAGRARRTRRRVGTVALAAAVVAVVGVGVAVVAGLDDGPARSSQVATQDPAGKAYAELGAFSVGEHVSVGDSTVELSPAPHHLAQTSVGVVTQQHGGDGAPFRLVRPDGEVSPLSIPADAWSVSGDPHHPRVAWLVPLQNEGWVHVWDVVGDQELASLRVELPGDTPEGGKSGLREVQLDGDFVHVGTDARTVHRVDWRTGEDQELPFSPVDVHDGVATSFDDDGRWTLVDAATGEVVRDLGRRIETVKLSPDGEHVLVVRFDDNGSRASIEPTTGGTAVELPGFTGLSSWTVGGRVVGQLDREPATLRRCDVDGACTDATVSWIDDANPIVLPADYLMVG
ncbi:hypothetical protein ACFFOS_23430 [Nocardioides kongjuensis]|uniref:WD40 repeat domain-containing protein n=1 Tax=Nocardioides kongjuensis TaxID=349522 RepID=A0A852RF49_9ACTN|nr:hypothetical protein [Nocardioides kongjuensis]NYD32191.1 hypothetical protein [Nocardioides kongjuensis]